MVTLLELRDFAPAGRDDMLKAIAENWRYADRAGIDTPLRICHFMAQIFVESAGLRVAEENLHYSAKRLVAVWPSRFKSLAAAEPYSADPRALANKVYGGRMGNTGADDGWTYRGRGPKQITGKENYREIGRRIGVDLLKDPDALLKPAIGFRAAVAYWEMTRCNRHADRNDIRAVTKAVNGGYNGLADRRAAFRAATRVWGDDQVAEIGGKGPLASNTGRASLVGGGAVGLATVAEGVSQARELASGSADISDLLGVPLITVILGIIAIGAIVYILRDRFFIARHEGL